VIGGSIGESEVLSEVRHRSEGSDEGWRESVVGSCGGASPDPPTMNVVLFAGRYVWKNHFC
jgi:hypothetical protein